MAQSPQNEIPPTQATRRRTPAWVRRPGRFLSQNAAVAAIAAWLGYWFLRFVFATNKWHVEPADALEQVQPDLPVIVAVWHGQHVLLEVHRDQLCQQRYRAVARHHRHAGPPAAPGARVEHPVGELR